MPAPSIPRRRVGLALLGRRLLPLLGALAAWAPTGLRADGAAPSFGRGDWVHAVAAYGEPALPRGFSHFPYADPAAPKGGTMVLDNPDRRSSFDKFNYFTLRGQAPAGLNLYMFETLATRGADEPMTMYGLLAEEIRVEPDLSAITFRLHPKARFSNGDPVLAADVKHSFDMLSSSKAGPDWQTRVAAAKAVVVVDERTVRFELADRSRGALFEIGTGLPVFSRKWGLKPDGSRTPFDEIVTEHPIASGPYTIAATDTGRRIEFVRNRDYWAREQGVRRGMFNFDRVVYRYYKDRDVGAEAFKAGEYDIIRVYGLRTFVRGHQGPKWDSGRIVREMMKTQTGQALQSYQLNLRRPIFQDIRVREALGLSWDFAPSNRFGLFKQADSLFNNSDFAARGLPSPGELALLEPFRAQLPKEVFGPPYQAPRSDSAQVVRANLLKARSLLEAAGWKLAADGRLRNAKGEPFEVEYMSTGQSTVREETWQRNLDKLGIRLNIRQVDYALFNNRLNEYDFDMVTIVEGRFTLPAPADYVRMYSSKSADEKGNDNYRGVKHPAVDHILEAMKRAASMQELTDACRALDRVVMWHHWQVPQLYLAALPVSYWNKFGMPRQRPKYFTLLLPSELDPQIQWPNLTWWDKSLDKRPGSPAGGSTGKG